MKVVNDGKRQIKSVNFIHPIRLEGTSAKHSINSKLVKISILDGQWIRIDTGKRVLMVPFSNVLQVVMDDAAEPSQS